MCSRQPSLDVIHEVDERDVISPQVPVSSSPCLCSVPECLQCNPDSASSSYSRSSRTSISDPPESVLDSKQPSVQTEGSQDDFFKDLCGRLAKLSREREIMSRHGNEGHTSSFTQLCTSLRPPNRIPLSGSYISTPSLNNHQHLGLSFKRARSENHKLRTQATDGSSLSQDRFTTPSIKRSFSLADLYGHERSADARGDLLPQPKKRRLPSRSSTFDRERFATQTATSRRARSLRDVAGDLDKDSAHSVPLDPQTATQITGKFIGSSSNKENAPGWVSTVPCSPQHQPHLQADQGDNVDLIGRIPQPLPLKSISPLKLPSGVVKSGKVRKSKKAVVKAIPFDVPIIAPPSDHTWRPPLSEEAQAKIRLRRFKEREQEMMNVDWMLANGVDEANDDQLAERKPVEATFVKYEFVYEDISQVMAYTADSDDEEDGIDEDVEMKDARMDERSERGKGSISKSSSGEQNSWADISGIKDREIIGWILEALPSAEDAPAMSSLPSRPASISSDDTCSSFNSPYFPSSCSSSSSSDPRMSQCGALPYSSMPDVDLEEGRWNLMDQLLYSPETRFHAAYLFRRFTRIIFGYTEDLPSRSQNGYAKERSQLATFAHKFSWDIEGCELITLDVAVGCLALSVKLHRDFLPPLLPVRASEYEELAPHEMCFGDLEAAQRDILSALSYNLGSTPQAVLDDLWIALPSLRELLDFRDGGWCGWSLVLQETWEILFTVVVEPELMDFPLSLLTTAALLEALESSIVRKYESCDPWYYEFLRRRARHRSSDSAFVGDIVCYKDIAEKVLTRAKKERICKAKMECEGVMLDIQAVMGIADGPLATCRKWIAGVGVKK